VRNCGAVMAVFDLARMLSRFRKRVGSIAERSTYPGFARQRADRIASVKHRLGRLSLEPSPGNITRTDQAPVSIA
jgi:hypothetical protein